MTARDSLDVCFLVNHLDTGGAQTLLRNIVELDDRPNVTYTVCYAGGTDELADEFQALGVDVVDLGARTEPPQFDPRPVLQTVRYFGNREFDVVHAHLPYASVLGRIAGNRSDAAVVTTHHSISENYHPIERTLERTTRGYNDATVYVSEAVADSFDDRSGAPELTIYNGIDSAAFENSVRAADSEGLRGELGVGDDTLALNVGHCIEEKRQLDLVRAVDRLADDDPGVHVAIVGDGPGRSALEHAVRERGLDDHVSVVGRVPASEIYRYYAAADVYAQVSVYEGMPMTLLEAMSAGLPIVGTDVPGIAEFVEDGETGRIVPVASPAAIAGALSSLDESQRQRMGRTCSDRVAERYDIDRTVEAYHTLYEDLTSEPTVERAAVTR